ncbi:hypothetical protein ABVK25_007260 [Lepraria finkii]|uniref:Uncharacterized protein n=1 Tax=Lepraria finkii TaxID=1340010 RepID=A0ABR4B971_9LECA
MPSLNRLNAPDRLPSSDFGNLFSRPRALRVPDSASPNTPPSPLCFPTNYLGTQPRKRRTFGASEFGSSNPSSPLASPAIVTAQRRSNSAERQSHHSALSDRFDNSRELSCPPRPPLEAVKEELFTLRHRSSSSLSYKARKILGISGEHVTPGVSKDEEPPHEARRGFRWSRDFKRGWLEIRV